MTSFAKVSKEGQACGEDRGCHDKGRRDFGS
jgi:hypothetical protein